MTTAHRRGVCVVEVYTTDIAGYKGHLGRIGEAYRAVFDNHYPPMALIGVADLFDPRAKVELVGIAVIPA